MDFEEQSKEAVNEEHEGKRKCELNWKIHRLHWEKNRFIFDVMYKRKAIKRDLVSAAVFYSLYACWVIHGQKLSHVVLCIDSTLTVHEAMLMANPAF